LDQHIIPKTPRSDFVFVCGATGSGACPGKKVALYLSLRLSEWAHEKPVAKYRSARRALSSSSTKVSSPFAFTLSLSFGLSERQDGWARFRGSITKSLDADRERQPTFNGSLDLSCHLNMATPG
jgi:hypothetical protein